MFQTLVIAVLSIGIGLAACFIGYQLFRVLLPFLAALYGYNVAAGWFSPEAWFWPLIIGVLIGIAFAALAYFLWSLTVGVGGVTLGFGLGTQLAAFLGLGGMLSPVIGIVVAVLIDILFFSARDVMVIAQNLALQERQTLTSGNGTHEQDLADLLALGNDLERYLVPFGGARTDWASTRACLAAARMWASSRTC